MSYVEFRPESIATDVHPVFTEAVLQQAVDGLSRGATITLGGATVRMRRPEFVTRERRADGAAARLRWKARILADLDREHARQPVTAAEIRSRLFASPLPRRPMPDGRLGPQAYATSEPLPLP